ncbi:hypothetical protein [Glycomyces tarimensis]
MNDARSDSPHEPPHGSAAGPPPPPPPAQAPYGYPYPVYVNAGPPPPPRTANGMGTAALSLGIPCAAVSWIPGIGVLGWIGGVVAIVLGSVGIARARRGQATNFGVALAGALIGALAVLIGIAVVIWLFTW